MPNGDDGDDEGHEHRLSDLEVAEEKRTQSRSLDRRFELFEAIILLIAAVLAAWTGFQSAKWSGVQANSYSQAGASRVESTKSSTLAGQETTIDVITFTQWLQAAQQEGLFAQPVDPNTTYAPNPNTVSGFLYQRFRPEFAVAVKAWVSTHPRISAKHHRLRSPCGVQGGGDDRGRSSGAAGRRPVRHGPGGQPTIDNYVLMTIVFATVLFFAGISSKMDTFRARALLLGVGTTLLVGAVVIVLSFPKQV